MNTVAVTGLGAVTPVGNDVPALWDWLIAGRHGLGPITRFDTTDFKAKLAAEVKGVDPLTYMAKNEARKMDLFSQYAMAAACQAMDDSKLAGTWKRQAGCVFRFGHRGMTTFCEEYEKLKSSGPRRISPFFIPMLISNIAAGSIAIRFDAKGPCLPVVTACATGSSALGEALRAIRHGYVDAVIAGGTEASIVPLAVAGFSNMTALSASDDPDAASLPFDARRGGFVMGEGAGALILEEYEHARRRGAKIYAKLVCYGSTCDAYHITAPDPDAGSSARAIKDALAEAGGAEGIIYINAHGTGTPLNDISETVAVKTALGEKASSALVSSTKSMTGHMLGAAGAVEAVVSVLALHTGMIPPTVGLMSRIPGATWTMSP